MSKVTVREIPLREMLEMMKPDLSRIEDRIPVQDAMKFKKIRMWIDGFAYLWKDGKLFGAWGEMPLLFTLSKFKENNYVLVQGVY